MTAQPEPWRDVEPTGRLLRPNEVFSATGLSRSQVYQLIADGQFPPFVKLGKRASAMPSSWLDAFVKEAARRALAKERAAA